MAQQAKIVYAGVNNTSYAQAETDLDRLAEMTVDDKQVRRLCKQIGAERCVERDAAAAAYQALPLGERTGVPAGVTAPDLAVVGADGGRLPIFDRSATHADVPADAAAAPAPGAATDREDNGRHWREDKIGLLLTMSSAVPDSDPCPEIPDNFVNPLRILKLAREFKKPVPPAAEAAQDAADPLADQQAYRATDAAWEPPEVQAKRLVASRRPWESFGPLLATAAWQWGFFGASRPAFLGDGAETNWTRWRDYFSSLTPVLDFIPALSYVLAAAVAGRPFAAGWVC